MARSNFSARRVINGTYGSVWLDDERMAECHTCQAKVQINTETINLDGEFMENYKPISGKGSGSLTLYKVDSGLISKLRDLQKGIVPEFTITTKLADPDAAGAERAALYGVMFSDLTIADWQRATAGKVTAPFTFTRYEMLDSIDTL